MEDQLDQLTDLLQQRLFVEIEASGRHVHVTREQAQILFGHDLTEKRPLSQPGQYLSNERVQLKGPKGRIENVAVLGPCRKEGQVEVSATDAVTLGVHPPVRLSGDVEGSLPMTLIGPKGTVELSQGTILAQRHIHMTPRDAEMQRVRDGELVRLKTMTRRPVIFEAVAVRVSDQFRTYAHLDFDEANACGFRKGDLGMILR